MKSAVGSSAAMTGVFLLVSSVIVVTIVLRVKMRLIALVSLEKFLFDAI